MNMEIFWLVLAIVCLVVEIATVALVSIWFTGGALIAFIAALLGFNPVTQVIVFIVVTVLLLILTRPVAARYFNRNRTKTNYEGVIGKTVRITEKVDNISETGTAFVNGLEWTARSEYDNIVIEKGELAQVVNISGVKLIVKKI